MATAARLEVRGKDKKRPREWARPTSIQAELAQRARILLAGGYRRDRHRGGDADRRGAARRSGSG